MDDTIIATPAELAAAFQLWRARAEEHPEDFNDYEGDDPAEVAARDVRYIVQLLDELRSRAAHPTAAA